MWGVEYTELQKKLDMTCGFERGPFPRSPTSEIVTPSSIQAALAIEEHEGEAKTASGDRCPT